jgi:hypothetical protein
MNPVENFNMVLVNNLYYLNVEYRSELRELFGINIEKYTEYVSSSRHHSSFDNAP